MTSINKWMKRILCRVIFFLMLLAGAPPALAAQTGQKSYASAEAAIAGLVEAVKTDNEARLAQILGSHGSKLISSGDAVADERGRAAFLRAFNEANKLVLEGNARAELVIGKDEWPFPIPLVKNGNTWSFDTEQGEREILDRRIGRNELAAIQVCLAIVDAEREYAASHLDKDGIPHYAPKIVSAPGKHDGLYWPASSNEPPSPLGPLVAAAATEGYTSGRTQVLAPYHGYFYRILDQQGKNVPGGAYSYFIKGRMIGGFAVIAYPARYGASGIKTFAVDNDGVVFEKDMGKDTGKIAPRITSYDPDSSWEQADVTSRK